MQHTTVINWVNEIRHQYGLSDIDALPKGRKYGGNDCPLARALSDPALHGVVVGATCAHITVRSGQPVRRHYFPQAIRNFILEFDSGRLPELIA
jgi:hypothetical protein